MRSRRGHHERLGPGKRESLWPSPGGAPAAPRAHGASLGAGARVVALNPKPQTLNPKLALNPKPCLGLKFVLAPAVSRLHGFVEGSWGGFRATLCK